MLSNIVNNIMTKEEKDLLLKDLCARLPYGVKVINSVGEISTLVNPPIIIQDDCFFKPYLRSMSSMTEEEEKELEETLQYTQFTLESYDWLNAHYFDYRGLIEKGLVLEAPEGMYREIIGIKESPLKTFPRINEFDTDSSYRR